MVRKTISLNMNLILCFIIIGLLSGCAYQRPAVVLTPHITHYEGLTLEDAPTVALRVRDDRPIFNENIRLVGLHNTTQVEVTNDIVKQVYEIMVAYLIERGFNLVAAELNPERSLNVSILEFYVTQRFAVVGTRQQVHARVDVIVQDGPERYSRTYTVNEQRFIFNASTQARAQQLSQQLNDAFNTIFTEIANDPEIVQTLLKDPAVNL